MSENSEGKHESEDDGVPEGRPLPKPIYDLTTTDETELVKAAGPRERGDE